MTPTPDLKKKQLVQIDAIELVFEEHGVKARLSDIGQEMFEFTVTTNKPLNLLVRSLYMRDGVERVLVNGHGGRGVHYIQICLTSF